jgi:23S rRNA pseudouridine1911/1915/1917 synthase
MRQKQRNEKPKRREEKPKTIPVTHTFTVKRSDELLAFLLARFEGKLSRNSVKTLLSDRKVLVNGSMTTQFNYPLAKDDEIRIAKNPIRTAPVRKQATPAVPSFKPYLIYEDEEFLVMNKPAGLLSVESDKDPNCAYAMAVEYLKKKDPRARPYILHRIDKETSGVLIFAKDIKIHSMLRMHWNEDITKREYFAVVQGVMDEETGHLVSWLRENQNHLVYVAKDHTGKKAITNYQVSRSNGVYSLLRVEIETGRKNQIRVQMNDLNHPILGDDKYGLVPSPIGRLCLHASALEFIHPVTKKPMRFHAPVPDEFNTLVGKRR